jgi:hypothetical protein
VFAGATRGDGIWMFSRNGTMKSLPATTAAPGGGPGGPGRPPPAAVNRYIVEVLAR